MRYGVITAAFISLLSLVPSARTAEPPGGRHAVELPTAPATAPPVKVIPVYDAPHLKLATITLRDGAVLERHTAPMPVTIQVLVGEAEVTFDDGHRERVSPSRLVALEASVPHAVVPVGKATVVLLVHHMKQRTAPAGP